MLKVLVDSGEMQKEQAAAGRVSSLGNSGKRLLEL
jgi:hypothetical protein